MQKRASLRLGPMLLSALLTVLSLALSLASCAGEECLYRVDDPAEGRIYEVWGKNGRATRLRVTKDGHELLDARAKAHKSVGDRGADFGLEIVDLNFDGLNDLKLPIKAEGELLEEICFLQTADGYERSRELEQLYTIGTDPAQKAVFGLTHSRSELPPRENATPSYISTDTVTAYTWQNGKLAPYRRVSLSYHSEQNVYIYSVSDYSEELGSFLDPDDRFFTPAEYAQTDFSAFYYYR